MSYFLTTILFIRNKRQTSNLYNVIGSNYSSRKYYTVLTSERIINALAYFRLYWSDFSDYSMQCFYFRNYKGIVYIFAQLIANHANNISLQEI